MKLFDIWTVGNHFKVESRKNKTFAALYPPTLVFSINLTWEGNAANVLILRDTAPFNILINAPCASILNIKLSTNFVFFAKS